MAQGKDIFIAVIVVMSVFAIAGTTSGFFEGVINPSPLLSSKQEKFLFHGQVSQCTGSHSWTYDCYPHKSELIYFLPLWYRFLHNVTISLNVTVLEGDLLVLNYYAVNEALTESFDAKIIINQTGTYSFDFINIWRIFLGVQEGENQLAQGNYSVIDHGFIPYYRYSRESILTYPEFILWRLNFFIFVFLLVLFHIIVVANTILIFKNQTKQSLKNSLTKITYNEYSQTLAEETTDVKPFSVINHLLTLNIALLLIFSGIRLNDSLHFAGYPIPDRSLLPLYLVFAGLLLLIITILAIKYRHIYKIYLIINYTFLWLSFILLMLEIVFFFMIIFIPFPTY